MKKVLLLFITIFHFVTVLKAQHFEWVRQIGGPNPKFSESMNIDNKGHVFMTGRFFGTLDIDPGPDVFELSAVGTNNGFISKFDTSGNFIWGIGLIGGEVYWSSVIVDENQNIYSSGFFYGVVDFDPGPGIYNLTNTNTNPNQTSGDIFVAKWDSSGNLIWAKNFQGNSHDRVFSFSLDDHQNIYLAGDFNDSIDADPGTNVYTLKGINTYNIFISKLDKDGNFIWAKTFEGTNQSTAFRIAYHATGYIYVTGDYIGNVNFGTTLDTSSTPSSGTRASYIVKMDTLGTLIWVKLFESSFSTDIRSFVTDSIGNIYLTGRFNGTTDFDPSDEIYELSTLTSQDDDIFICKLNYNGELIWAKQIGANVFSDEGGSDIAIDSMKNLYISGYISNTAAVDVNPGPETFILSTDIHAEGIILKLDSNGVFNWAVKLNTSDIEVDANNNIFTYGMLTLQHDIDPGPGTLNLTPISPSSDLFLLKIYQDDCELALFIDSIKSISCTEPGLLAFHADYGQSPYSYKWNITPSIDDSSSVITQPGIYSMSVTDFYGCMRKISLIITEPKHASTFDLNVNLIADEFRPGFNSTIRIDAINDGCVPIDGSLELIKPSVLNNVSASEIPDYINMDTIGWNYSDLTADSPPIKNIVTFYSPDTLVMGDIVCFYIKINTNAVGDENPVNNTKKYCFPILNSYDPNDKQVYPKEGCRGDEVLLTEPITYTIRFQNTGNASAINVYILDTLSRSLDIKTARVIGHSHNLITEVLDTNILKFRLDNIMLPDSFSNEPESHGYVILEVLPNAGIPNETIVKNRVGIYFDFNEPIITNTVTSTLVAAYSEINNSVDNSNLPVLRANESGANYQWIFCDSTIINGATSQNFNPLVNGNYAVIINKYNCSAISPCFSVQNTSLSNKKLPEGINFFPNPTDGDIVIQSDDEHKDASITIRNILGEVVLFKQFDLLSNYHFHLNEKSGIYLVELNLEEGKTFHYKVIKK